MSENESEILQAWEKVRSWIDAREDRERKVIAAVLCAVLALVWYQWFGSVKLAQHKGLAGQIESADGEISRIKLSAAETEAELQRDPNARIREEIARLKVRSKQLSDQVGKLSKTWVTPEQMAEALRRVLGSRGNLRLVSLTSEEPSLLGNANTGAQAGSEDQGAFFSVYRHGMVLVLDGSFFDVLGYLEELEKSAWRFHWDGLNYQVEEFPRATVTLRMQTYSAERAWIGV